MSLSLKEIKIPNEWINIKPNELDYMDHVYNETLKLKVWRENNIQDYNTHFNCTDLTKYFYPRTKNVDRLVIGAFLMVWFFSFDDYFDSLLVTDQNQIQLLIKRMNYVIIEEKEYDNDSNGPERLILHILKLCKDICKNKNRIDLYHSFKNSCIQWVDSQQPFLNLKNKETPDLNLYIYIRKINIGLIPCIILNGIIEDNDIEMQVWNDSRWIRMCEYVAAILALFNDLISYGKEIDENGAELNPLYFLQVQKNINLNESFKIISNEINSLINDYLILESSFLKSYCFNNDLKKQNQLQSSVEDLRNMITSCNSWSLQTPRYHSKSQPFIELERKE